MKTRLSNYRRSSIIKNLTIQGIILGSLKSKRFLNFQDLKKSVIETNPLDMKKKLRSKTSFFVKIERERAK